LNYAPVLVLQSLSQWNVSLAIGATDSDVFDSANDIPAVAIAYPAELGQKNPAVVLSSFILCR
jgi:hypothetical protein